VLVVKRNVVADAKIYVSVDLRILNVHVTVAYLK
jgi:hypothetical protein